jgi:DNA-binding PadR family transcriptional regulator
MDYCNWLHQIISALAILCNWLQLNRTAGILCAMSLPHALLTALVERPCTGADLARRFDRSIGYFWQATHQQIYRELGRLEDAGWVVSEPVEDSRGRQRLYQVKPAGRKELKRWVADTTEPRALRDELMVRLRAEAALGPSGLDAEIRRRIEQHRHKLAIYREIESRDFAQGADTRERKLQYLVLKAGIDALSLRIGMEEEALRVLALPPSR